MIGLEILTYIGVCTGLVKRPGGHTDGSFGMFNHPCAVYDPVCGYRWIPGETRTAKIVEGTLVFDQLFSPNKQGFLSPDDFKPEKSDSSVFRYIVFGDSFTAAEFLETPWPHEVQDYINRHYGGSIELYSFAIDGGGLVNWHQTFLKEVLPHYDFDGVILAIFGNDLDRKFFAMHHTDSLMYNQYFDSPPASLDVLEQSYLDSMHQTAVFYSDNQIDSILLARLQANRKKGVSFEKPDFYFSKRLLKLAYTMQHLWKKKQFEKQYFSKKSYLDSLYQDDFVQQLIAPDKMGLIQEIADSCHARNAGLIFTVLPYKEAIRDGETGDFHSISLETMGLAEHFGGSFFDGESIFYGLEADTLDACFLPYDVHWSQKGSSRFARKFAAFLAEKQGFQSKPGVGTGSGNN